MADSNATYTRSVVVDLPDAGDGTIEFHLKSSVAINSVTEILPKRIYALPLDANGEGTIALPCPDNTGDDAWLWHVVFPGDGQARGSFTLAYNAASIELGEALAAVASTATASDLTAITANKADKDTDATAGNVLQAVSGGNYEDAGIATTDVALNSENLSGLDSAATARTNLGLGTIATQNDAASDGTTYGRQNGSWVDVSTGLLPKTAGASEAVTGVLHLDPGSDDVANVLKIPVTSTDGADFNMNLNNTTFLGVDDITFNWGFHVAAGGPTDSSKHAWYLQLEYEFNDGGTRYSEYHLNYYDDGGTPTFRPFQYNVRTDGLYSYAVFTGDQWTWRNRSESSLMVLGTSTFNLYTATNQIDGTLRALDTFTLINNTPSTNVVLNIAASGKTTLTSNQSVELELSGWSVVDFLSNITQTATSAQWNVSSFIVNGAPLLDVIGGSGTSDNDNIAIWRRITSATAANGFGLNMQFELEAGNGLTYDAAIIEVEWNDATWNTRKADVVFSPYDTAAREALRLRADGTQPLIIVSNIPTSDPAVAGALWSDAGTVKVSSG